MRKSTVPYAPARLRWGGYADDVVRATFSIKSLHLLDYLAVLAGC